MLPFIKYVTGGTLSRRESTQPKSSGSRSRRPNSPQRNSRSLRSGQSRRQHRRPSTPPYGDSAGQPDYAPRSDLDPDLTTPMGGLRKTGHRSQVSSRSKASTSRPGEDRSRSRPMASQDTECDMCGQSLFHLHPDQRARHRLGCWSEVVRCLACLG